MGLRDGGSGRFSLQNILNLVIRFLQIVFALAVVGLYAQDLNKATKVPKYSSSKWVSCSHIPHDVEHVLTPISTGLCDSSRRPQRRHRSHLRGPANSHQLLHNCDPLRMGCRPLRTMDCCLWPFRGAVHQRERDGGWWCLEDEERCLD